MAQSFPETNIPLCLYIVVLNKKGCNLISDHAMKYYFLMSTLFSASTFQSICVVEGANSSSQNRARLKANNSAVWTIKDSVLKLTPQLSFIQQNLWPVTLMLCYVTKEKRALKTQLKSQSCIFMSSYNRKWTCFHCPTNQTSMS